jgi:hypothetical protein
MHQESNPNSKGDQYEDKANVFNHDECCQCVVN